MAYNFPAESGHDYQFVETPPDDLVCLICTFVAKDPQQLVCCGRVFCRGCLEKQREHSHACPQCRRQSQSFNDTRSDRHIKGLIVKCDNSNNGCDWTGELRSIQEHHDACGYAIVECPRDCKCKGVLLRKNLQTHLKFKCTKRPYTCPHCREEGEYQERITTHIKVCPMVKVSCPNRNCHESVARSQMEHHRSVCPWERVVCRYQSEGCQLKLVRNSLMYHIQNQCLKRPYQCPHCKETGVYDGITSKHLEVCPNVHVPCPNSSCPVRPKRCQVEKHRMECEYEIVDCKYVDIGCEAKLCRKHAIKHEKKIEEHFGIAIETIQKLKRSNAFHFKLTEFEKLKSTQSDFYSKPFYTHPGGYKMIIRVCVNGNDSGKGTHVSVFAYLMKGENDDNLQWPFAGAVTVQLLNQLEDKNHYLICFEFPSDNDVSGRVSPGGIKERSEYGFGYAEFLPQSELAHNSAKNCQYLRDDCLYFRVDTKVNTWLLCS